MSENESMYTKTESTIALYKKTPKNQDNNQVSNQLNQATQDLKTIENFSFVLNERIAIRELDKRYTHANPKRGKCIMECCNNLATHWLTRSNNRNYCQSDLVCNQHAKVWMQVKDLISESPEGRN